MKNMNIQEVMVEVGFFHDSDCDLWVFRVPALRANGEFYVKELIAYDFEEIPLVKERAKNEVKEFFDKFVNN